VTYGDRAAGEKFQPTANYFFPLHPTHTKKGISGMYPSAS
jgi:hypothetical protein